MSKIRQATRIDAAIGIEISFVDRPCNQASKIEHITIAKRAPEEIVTNEEMGAVRKFVRALFNGEPEIAEHIDKVAARKDVDEADKARAKKEYGDVKFADEKNKREDIEKGMFTCSMVAGVLDQLDMIYQDTVAERVREGDDSKVPEMIKGVRDSLAEAFVAMTQEESHEITEKTMALSEAAERLIKDFREGAGIFKAASAAPVAPAKTDAPIIKAEDVDGLIKAISEQTGVRFIKMDAEMEALTQGAHDAMAAAGAPPHHESDDEMDADQASKVDGFIDLIKAANGIDDDTRAGMIGAFEKAKFGKKTGENLAKAHDLITKIGAKCNVPGMAKGINMGEMRKMLKETVASAVDPLKKAIEAKDAEIADLRKQIESRPTGLPDGLQLRTVEKSGASAPYTPPGTAPAMTAPPAAPATPRIINDATEIMPAVRKVHETQRGANGIEGLMH